MIDWARPREVELAPVAGAYQYFQLFSAFNLRSTIQVTSSVTGTHCEYNIQLEFYCAFGA